MRIVVAPDKFTGSLTAAEAAAAVALGLRDALPDASTVELPVADGGDGTLDALVSAGWSAATTEVHGPTGRPVTTRIARRDRTAVVELADCCGRLRLPDGIAAPMTASTRGLGEAVSAAVHAGASEVVVAVGGSASTDGGLGLLRALGVAVLDGDGDEIEVPAGLVRARRIEVSRMLPGLRGVRVTLATDVSAPLTGRSGAARLFGPQKGATPAQVEELEWAMSRWGDVLTDHCGRRVGEQPGAGAAGGVVAGVLGALSGLCDVRTRPGADVVLGAIGLDDALARADVVVVGEGSLDAQSLLGKAPVAVARLGAQHGCRVVAVAGRLDLDARSLRRAHVGHIVTLTDLAGPGEDPMRDAAMLARRAGHALAQRLGGARRGAASP